MKDPFSDDDTGEPLRMEELLDRLDNVELSSDEDIPALYDPLKDNFLKKVAKLAGVGRVEHKPPHV